MSVVHSNRKEKTIEQNHQRLDIVASVRNGIRSFCLLRFPFCSGQLGLIAGRADFTAAPTLLVFQTNEPQMPHAARLARSLNGCARMAKLRTVEMGFFSSRTRRL
jgi:hypothetical protein